MVGWIEKKIKDIAPLQRGFDLPNKDIVEGKYPIVYSNGVGGYHNVFMAKAPGLVTGRSGTIGTLHFVDENYWPHNTTLWVTDFKGNDPKFIYYLYQTINWKKYASGSGVPTLNRNDIHDTTLHISESIPEQCAIAALLTDADGYITALNRLIAKKQNIKQGAMQKLLNPKDGWEEKTLFELAPNLRMGQSPDSSYYNNDARGLPLIQGNADIENRKTIIRSYTSEITKRASAGDIILTVRAPVGNVAKAMFDCCLGRGVCAFSYPNEFLYHWLVSYEPCWGSISTGSIFDSISGDKLKEVIITLPKDSTEQQQIAAILSDMDSEIDMLSAKLNKAKLIKKGMMEQLLTGKIQLTEISPSQEVA